MSWICAVNRIDCSRRPACFRRVRRAASISLAMGVAFFSAGCQLAVNPFKDELVDQRNITTASVDGIRATEREYTPRHATGASWEIRPEDGTVAHYPLYFEDPYESSGSEDGKFAWTWEDYWQILYWRGRFAVNFLILPVTAVMTPPWTVMASDGYLSPRAFGEKHDAAVWKAPAGERQRVTEVAPTPPPDGS